MVKAKEKYFKTKYRSAGILLKFHATIYFKYKLLLNLETIKMNLLCFSVSIEACTEKYIKLHLKFRNKNTLL
jgi:hypothetical protein